MIGAEFSEVADEAMREARELLDWVRHVRETRVTGTPGTPDDQAMDIIRDTLLDQACAVAYSALRLTALLQDDLPAHRDIVAEWLGVDVPDDASLDELNSIVETEMAIQEAGITNLRKRAFEDDSGTAH